MFKLKKVCKDCPFRKDIRPYIRPERAEEIAEQLTTQDGWFSCHKTTTSVGKTNMDKGAQHCVGALIFSEKVGHINQMMRIAERFGEYDRKEIELVNKDVPIYDSKESFIDAQRGN